MTKKNQSDQPGTSSSQSINDDIVDQLDRWGSDLANWPDVERQILLTQLEDNEAIRDLFEQTKVLDRQIRQTFDHALILTDLHHKKAQQAILAKIETSSKPTWFRSISVWASAAAIAIVVVLLLWFEPTDSSLVESEQSFDHWLAEEMIEFNELDDEGIEPTEPDLILALMAEPTQTP